MNQLFLKDIVTFDDKKYLIMTSSYCFGKTWYEIRIIPITDGLKDGIPSVEDFMNSYKRQMPSKKKAIRIHKSLIEDKNLLLDIIKEG